MNTMVIILIIYYVVGGLYYTGKYIEDAFLQNRINQDNVCKIGIAGGLYGIFWLILVIYYVICRLMSNASGGQIYIDTIKYIFYPMRMGDYIKKQFDEMMKDEEQ